MSDLLGIIGDPVAHSLSPFIQNGWLRKHGYAATYLAFHVPPDDLPGALDTLMRRGARGLNVTLPHKEHALKLAHEASALAQRIGAANVLVRNRDGGWRAENTDAPGFRETLIAAGIEVAGERVFILGAGGAARAVAVTLSDLKADLVICNRTPERAAALVAATDICATVCGLDDGLAQLGEAGLVINTLSLGHSGARMSLPEGNAQIFYDISYGHAAAAVLTEARAKGWRTLDGLGMLVAQAALSFEHWYGVRPDLAEAHERARKLIAATA
jgi:shikimate dehydrogenase